jgi:adenylate cyclase
MKKLIQSLSSANAVTLTIGTVALIGILFVANPSLLDHIELKAYDLRFLSRGPQPATGQVVMALVDENSLDEEGRWPWPRSVFARLVGELSRANAKVIGFDMGFFEPDENAEYNLIQQLGQTVETLGIDSHPLDQFLASRRQAADNDRVLANAIERSSADVILGYFFHMSAEELEKEIGPDQLAARLAQINASKVPMVLFDSPAAQNSAFTIRPYAPETNIEPIGSAADGAGIFHVTPSADGVVRRMPLVMQWGDHFFPHLTVLCARRYLDNPPLIVKIAAFGVESIAIGDRRIPTDESGQLLIRYLGPPMTIPHYSIGDILNHRVERKVFDGKIVLVGATAMGTYDLRNTPFSPKFPGVEINATAIENILQNRFMTKPEWARGFDLAAVIVLGLLAGFLLSRVSATQGLLVVALLAGVHVAAAMWLFAAFDVWLNTVYPLIALAAVYVNITTFRYITEERERKKIKTTFRQYVAPLVIDRMLEDPGRLTLGGEEKILTVLFSDLEGFTSYSEKYTPHEMTSFLSEYFERMTEQIFKYQGTLKEYVGDELMAIYGAPLAHPDHAQRACAAALAMQASRRELRELWSRDGRPPLSARTGINSGPMLVGNLGCRYRFAYGALGDQVNLGSRLEGMNKFYGTRILIGENTATLVRNDFILREVDTVRVVGKEQCVAIFELIGHRDTALSAEKRRSLQAYAEGYEEYCAKHWDKAIDQFETCLANIPDDGPARTMLARSHEFKQSPPPDDWDCVYVATSK